MSQTVSLPRLLVQVIVGFIIYGILFFVPAGTLEWMEAWIFLIITFLYVLVVIIYFWQRDPTILASRTKVKPEKGFDTVFIVVSGITFFSMFLITAFSVNPSLSDLFQWSDFKVPLPLEIIGFGGISLAFIIIFIVMRENAYASKRIEVQEGQKVISTGPYAYVRHPMYIGFIIMTICFPIALGSFLAVPPALLVIIFIAIRATYEEKALIEELEGYREYMEKVRYRLIPKIW
ncbi:MAG: isoprenylcysteine carboxylmethyltransferase family protein [Candidatus Heimdallarchaeota archaeon]|nr:MAG: isoprenylcysteine carboxylmethyltransferase family protein [Candidatus Heimdallarchaeota archaeon]